MIGESQILTVFSSLPLLHLLLLPSEVSFLGEIASWLKLYSIYSHYAIFPAKRLARSYFSRIYLKRKSSSFFWIWGFSNFGRWFVWTSIYDSLLFSTQNRFLMWGIKLQLWHYFYLRETCRWSIERWHLYEVGCTLCRRASRFEQETAGDTQGTGSLQCLYFCYQQVNGRSRTAWEMSSLPEVSLKVYVIVTEVF